MLFAGVYVCTFQPENFTGWDSEGVKGAGRAWGGGGVVNSSILRKGVGLFVTSGRTNTVLNHTFKILAFISGQKKQAE